MPITFTSLTFSTPKELVDFLVLCKANPDIGELDWAKQLMGRDAGTVKANENISFEDFVSSNAFKVNGTLSHQQQQDAKFKRRRKLADGPPLTEQIKARIETYITVQNEFSAMDIYNHIAQVDESVNKQSVISSVQKLMEGPYANVPRDFRQGKGPRPKKVYMPDQDMESQVG